MLQNKVCLKHMLKISPPASKHSWIKACILAKTSENVTSVMEATSRRFSLLSASDFLGLLLHTRPFSKPLKKKSGGVRSGDLGGHRFFDIIRPTK
jgi:hypothetical protein